MLIHFLGVSKGESAVVKPHLVLHMGPRACSNSIPDHVRRQVLGPAQAAPSDPRDGETCFMRSPRTLIHPEWGPLSVTRRDESQGRK